jgi:NAD(P)H-dependent FMN reductase
MRATPSASKVATAPAIAAATTALPIPADAQLAPRLLAACDTLLVRVKRIGTQRRIVVTKIAIVTGSTRPGRVNLAVAQWVCDVAKAQNRADAEFELVDIADYKLPLFDEPLSPAKGQYAHAHTKAWSERIKGFDAYVFVAPEYNHGPSAALKNAVDYLHGEWADKAAGFVSYGSMGGVRAVEHLRLVLAALGVATVRAQVMLSLFTDFEGFHTLKPAPHREAEVRTVLEQVVRWGAALSALRASSGPRAAA